MEGGLSPASRIFLSPTPASDLAGSAPLLSSFLLIHHLDLVQSPVLKSDTGHSFRRLLSYVLNLSLPQFRKQS